MTFLWLHNLVTFLICMVPVEALSRLKREKLYIFSSHLGLIRCLTPIRVSAIIYSQAFLDKHRNTTNVILPHELKLKIFVVTDLF